MPIVVGDGMAGGDPRVATRGNGGQVARSWRWSGNNGHWALAFGVALAAWCVLVQVVAARPSAVTAQLPHLGRTFAGALFLTAAAMQLARLRLTGDRRLAGNAAALLVIGASLPLIGALGELIRWGGATPHYFAPARLLVMVPVVTVLAIGAFAPAGRRLRPLRLAAAVVCGVIAAGVALAAAGALSPGLPPSSSRVWLVAELVVALGWAILAGTFWHRWRRDGRVSFPWRPVALWLMAAGEALHGWSVIGPNTVGPTATGFQLVAAAVVVTAAAGELRDTVALSSSRTLRLADGLEDARRELRSVEQSQAERLHDARSAVLGVLGVSRLLTAPTPVAAPVGEPGTLHQIMTAELLRLNRLLDPTVVEPVAEFSLAEALGPVIAAHRLNGLTIRAELGQTRALGRTGVTANVLAALLANVERHAGATTVTVRASESDGLVSVAVDDDGSGIPESERGLVLQRGWRGSTAGGAGSGLGLYGAATAMAGQAGSLRIADSARGGTSIVLTLPAARQLQPVRAWAS